jgi:hypothetical protein
MDRAMSDGHCRVCGLCRWMVIKKTWMPTSVGMTGRLAGGPPL